MKLNVIKNRYVWFAISAAIIITGIVFASTKGFKLDIDFKGGTNITANINAQFKNTDIEKIVEKTTKSKPLVQKVSAAETMVSITTDVISNEQSTEIVKALKESYKSIKDEPSVRNVQPAYTKELIASATKAIVIGVIFIIIYIAIRFKTLGVSAAIAAVLALGHDVLIMLSIYAIFRLPINSVCVAAILTIVGYSINDTVIVYDRIRENKRKILGGTKEDLINSSINQTMTRSIYTASTTVLCTSVVYILASINAQQVLKDFSFPLIIGIISGTYSSVFIASPIWYMLSKKKQEMKKGNK